MILRGEYAVHLHRNGELHSFLPGDDVPGWAAKLITNPAAWEESSDPDVEGESDTADPSGKPAKAGPGSSRQIWEDYASSVGVKVDPDWKREDIIAAVEKAEA